MLDLEKDCCYLPETVFMLGARYDLLSESVRETDRRKHLSLHNIVDPTPPVWIHVEGFHLGRRMVSNGEYLRFVEDQDSSGGLTFYNSPDVWHHVWSKSQLRFVGVQVPFEERPGKITIFEEPYDSALGFLDAYLNSLNEEVNRVLLGMLGSPESAPSPGNVVASRGHIDTRRLSGSKSHEVAGRLFAAAKYFLRESLNTGGELILTDQEQDAFGRYSEPPQIVADAGTLVMDLRKAYRHRVDKRFQAQISRMVEPIRFIERFATAVKKRNTLDESVPLKEVIYPREWASPGKPPPRARLGKQEVPWEEQPVFGLTLYEAAAYAAWLSERSGQHVTLPGEVEYERASSWPAEDLTEQDGALVLDPASKTVYPWQDRTLKDFYSFFGREGEDIANNYLVDKRKYDTLLEDTSRVVRDGDSIYMMEGFGWQWTRDHYSDDDRKYQRFHAADYPEYRDAEGRAFVESGKDGQAVRVVEHQINSNMNSPYFVLKGSPDILGGPGMSIRRYAAFPLRAYPNVGFRILVRES